MQTKIQCSSKGIISLHNDNGFEQFCLTKIERNILEMAMSNYTHVIKKFRNSYMITVTQWIDLIKQSYCVSNINTQAVINVLTKIEGNI